jgi:hypothetical protein|tara:strand:+ start:699 stop:1124 length:426 start_codon:yes stop_codon:yes gene_type:complete
MSNYRTFDDELLDLRYFADALTRLVSGADVKKRLKVIKSHNLKTNVLDFAFRVSKLLDGDSYALPIQDFTVKYIELTKEMKELRLKLEPADQKKLMAVVRKNKSLPSNQIEPNQRILKVLEYVNWYDLEKGKFDLSKYHHI